MAENYGEITYLKNKIREVISQDVDTVKEVVDYEKTGFVGFPAVTITCSGNENLFYSSAENERTFIFLMRVYVPIENKPLLETLSDTQKEIAEEIMENVVDQLLNAFDTTTNFTLDGSGDNGLEAVPSRWGYALMPVGWCRTAEIELRIRRTKLVV